MIAHMQVNSLIKIFYGICKIQASKHTHAQHNEVTLVWGSLRLTPIILSLNNSGRFSGLQQNRHRRDGGDREVRGGRGGGGGGGGGGGEEQEGAGVTYQ